MVRAFAVIVCLKLVSVVVAEENQSALGGSSRTEHKAEHACDPNESLPRLRGMLSEIIERQRRVGAEVVAAHNNHPHVPLPREPLLRNVAVVVIQKGSSATVTHMIEWRAYENDDLAVQLSVSDASLVAPKRLNLTFEAHQFRFAYEIKAGDKTGEFTVTLLPTAGNAVEVQVIVK